MFDSAQLAGFVGVAAVLVIIPGPNTVLILTSSLGGGRSAGLATVLGVETGTLVHTLAAAVGVSTVLASSAAAFDAVKYAGAAYLAFLGVRGLLSGRHPLRAPQMTQARLGQTYRRAVLTSVLNPKAAVFFLALLPQFVRPERGAILTQFIVLGGIVSVIGFAVGALLATAASRAHAWLQRASVARWQERLTGSVLLGLGARLALMPRD